MRCFSMQVKGHRKISLALSLLLGFILIAGAAVAVPVPVLAISAGGIKSTIASIIISLLLQTGVAPTNQAWLNQLNSAYGVTSTFGTIEDCISSGLLTETTSGLVDSGLSNAISSLPEYTSLGLDEMFTTTATDVGVTVASGATNIANTAINVGTIGTIGAFAGAAAVGVGIGILANKVYNYIKDYVKYGLPMSQDIKDTIINNIPQGYDKVCYGIRQNGSSQYASYYFFPKNVICVSYNQGGSNGSYSSLCASKTGEEFNCNIIGYRNTTEITNSVAICPSNKVSPYGPSLGGVPNEFVDRKTDANFQTKQDAENYITSWKSGNVQLENTVAPDIITPQGNASMTEGPGGNDIINGLGNIVPNGYDMKPVEMDNYQDYVDNANQNTEDGLTGEDTQGAEFDEFVAPYIVPYEEILPDPEPDEPLIPEYPDEIPEYPDRPVTPDQPTVPDKPDIPSEDVETNLDLTATPDLRGVFPFCIPWDIYNLVHIFDTGENRQAPRIVFTFPGTDWSIDIDLAVFNPVAAILRILQLILFIVGLMVATRSLIGAGG